MRLAAEGWSCLVCLPQVHIWVFLTAVVHVTMSLLMLLLAEWRLVLGLLTGFLVVKALVLWALAWAVNVPVAERPVFALLLAQGGEFAFVVFQQAEGAQILSSQHSSVLVGTVALSLYLLPRLKGALVAVQWAKRMHGFGGKR